MSQDFHSSAFSDGTKLKLEVFRRYIREWLSVFLTDSPKFSKLSSVNIHDFFSGPGGDVSGNPGSPVIIVEEIVQYCQTRDSFRSSIPLNLFFNDTQKSKIETLELI